MSAILTTLLGGLLAISGGLVGIALNDRRERTRWFRDAQLQASTNLLSALQLLVRRMINVAYLDPSEWMSQDSLDPKKWKDRDPKSAPEVAAFVEATVSWNNALYRALLIAPPSVATKIPELDREVDRLVDLAVSRIWTRTEFRQERASLGRMAADYLRLAVASQDSPISNSHRSGHGIRALTEPAKAIGQPKQTRQDLLPSSSFRARL